MWSVRVTDHNGKRFRLQGGPWATESEADDALTRWRAQRLDGDDARRELAKTPLKTVYLRSIANLGGLDESSDRRTFYKGVITGEAGVWVGEKPDRRFLSPIPGRIILGDQRVGDITIEVVEEWARSLANGPHPLGPSTIAKWGRHLSQCLDWAKGRNYITSNPVDGADLQPRGAVTSAHEGHYFFTLEEIVRLTEVAHRYPRWGVIIDTLTWSGLRQGECRALRPEAIIFKPGSMLHVTHSVSEENGPPVLGPVKTSASLRRVAIPSTTAFWLDELAQDTEPGQPLFPGESGGWMRGDWLNKHFRALCEEADIRANPHDRVKGRRFDPTPHDLRATGASILFAAGCGVPEVQAWLGHASAQMTLNVYTEVQGWGEEDPIIAGCRGRGLTVSEVLEEVRREAWQAHMTSLADVSAWDADL